MKTFIAFALLVCIAVDVQAASWSHLWLNRDQQGQRLLEAGKAAEAARTFDDARHRAYAQIQAGQYEDAAKQLQAFDDAESHYNRGNALARGGKLKESLAAYDRAIKQAPADSAVSRDAQHNRELVAQQLRKQQPPQSSSSDGNQSQSGGDASADNRQESSQSGKQSSGESGESGDHNSAGGSQTQSAQHDSRAQDSQGKSAAQQQASAQPHGGSANSSSQSQPSSETNSQDAAQARRDAEASLAQDKQDKQEADAAKQPITAQSAAQGEHGEDAGSPPAISEQALALDQWLRQIPDDPSGLLRRKFLIEHLRRQRESQR